MKVILPALASGAMWGIANSSFFLANNALSQAVTFPIVSSGKLFIFLKRCDELINNFFFTLGPSAIASLWGIILYKEIKGLKNFIILGIGFSLAVAGSVLTGLSK